MSNTDSEKLQIVVVEDSMADVVLLRQALDEHIGKSRYELRVFRDGAQGMHFVEHGSGTDRPDLMVVDINLPSYTGLEILQRMRQQTWLSETPVAILTTSDSKSERDQAERLGISCYLRKPPELFDFIALGAVLKRCVGTAP